MQSNQINLTTYISSVLAVGTLSFLCATSALAQTQKVPDSSPPISASRGSATDDSPPFSSMEEEMRAKREIKFAEKEYQENLERAHDLSEVGSEIIASFKRDNYLDQAALKKIDKMEKLAKAIRRAAGGSEDEGEPDKAPADLASALTKLGKLADSLKDKVEKTPRHVISATVIDEANALLELIRVVRSLCPKV